MRIRSRSEATHLWEFPDPLVPASLVRRYKRFLADVVLADGGEITVHCPNPGAMTSCCEEGAPVLMSPARTPTRKLPYTLELISIAGVWIGINPQRANSIVAGLVRKSRLTELVGYSEIESEVEIGASRLDFRLRRPDTPVCYVEVKQASYRSGQNALFPDARSARALRHLDELARCRARGDRAVIVFVISRADCSYLRPADAIDPEYGQALRRVCADGVEALSYRLDFDSTGVRGVEPVAVRL